ncbi:hypothetical protein AAIH32_20480 [Pseudarthrobacter oxydans]|uniref:hypothetical protein n=1 Tax=Pseudarthrobacter oxydans TaxID=1671 RepID=UPI003D27A142
MSALATFTDLGALSACANRLSADPAGRVDSAWHAAPLHCGTTMELVTPAVGRVAVGYTFEPDDGGPVQLPPVWRCGCGFQLDAWIRSPYASREQFSDSGEAHTAALSA